MGQIVRGYCQIVTVVKKGNGLVQWEQRIMVMGLAILDGKVRNGHSVEVRFEQTSEGVRWEAWIEFLGSGFGPAQPLL